MKIVYRVFDLMEKVPWKVIVSVCDPCSYDRYLSCSVKGLKNSRPERDTNPNFCNGSAVLYQCSCEVKWVQVVMLVDTKPVDGGYVYLIH